MNNSSDDEYKPQSKVTDRGYPKPQPSGQALLQIMVILMSDGTFQFGLPNLVETVQDKMFIVGVLEGASRAAGNMTLQRRPGVIVPDGNPIPDLRKHD